MTTRNRNFTHEEEAAAYIRNRLDAVGIKADVTARKQYVEIVSADAHPDQQRIINHIAEEHQRARSHIQTDSWSHDNRRDDIPQTEWVHHNPKFTREFLERLQAVVKEIAPNTHALEVDLFQTLFKGSRPEFWTRELGSPQPYRCTLCQQPINDVTNLRQPWDRPNRPMRHANC